MRCLEHVRPAVPERKGINPFTNAPQTFRGRPALTTRCELQVDGARVTRCWTWLEDSTPTGQPQLEVESFSDARQAEAFVDGCIEDLICNGFTERGREADAQPIRERALRPRATTDEHRQIARDIVSLCGKQRWFGADMGKRWQKEDDPEHRAFRWPRATEAQLVETERALGFALPPMLRMLYAEVANGGFGPGYGFVGAVGGAPESDMDMNLSQLYLVEYEGPPHLEESDVAPGEPEWFEPFYDEWPRGVLRLVHWGCAIWSCLDTRTGRVHRYEALHGKRARDVMILEADSMEQWLTRWLAGDSLWQMRSG
jgi:hypothetical protein